MYTYLALRIERFDLPCRQETERLGGSNASLRAAVGVLALVICQVAGAGQAESAPRDIHPGPAAVSAAAAATVESSFESVTVAPVWSGHPVGFAIETSERWQYVAFYDAQRRMTVARRALDSAQWSFHRLPSKLARDSHDDIAMAVDAAGYVHISGNMHGDPLVYFRSAQPHEISAFEQPGMVGSRDRRVSYPRFVFGGEGRLYFHYRDCKSGDGVQIVNVYDVESRRWSRLTEQPLLDGEGAECGAPVDPVHELISDRRGEYFLRWETLPADRDRSRPGPHPEPSLLRVYRRLPPGLDRISLETSSATPVPASSLEPGDEMPDAATLEEHEARIGRILIEVGNIFDESDPTEDKKIFRMANRLRFKTREEVIRRELLFASGDPYSQRLLEESERLLRSKGFLYEAEIEPTSYRQENDERPGEVDIVVRTRDVWTLTGGASFSRSGGENATRFHVEDTNFLGTGRELGISRESDVDRSGFEFLFRDHNLFGSRAKLELSLQENSDGYRRLLKLRRPFYSLDTRRSQGIALLTEERIDPLFDRGQPIAEFNHRIDQFTADWGFSRGLRESRARRWSFGFTFLRDRFTDVPGLEPLAELPPDRTISYPWVGFDWVEDRFIEAVDLDKIARIEDLNLGTVLSARLGWSSPAFGGDLNEALVGVDASTGFALGDGRLLLLEGTGGTRWSSEGFANAALSGSGRYYRRNFGRHVFFAEFQAAAVEGLDADRQLLIGGDSGLRGYPLRFQSGDRRLLLSLEQRFYSRREVFKLARFGAAIFVDAGRAWFAGGQNDLGVLKDAGFGLRLVPTRSSGKTVLHVDVAFPFDAGGSIESVQYLITTKETL